MREDFVHVIKCWRKNEMPRPTQSSQEKTQIIVIIIHVIHVCKMFDILVCVKVLSLSWYTFEPSLGKTNNLQRRKQRRRSASR